MWRTAACVRAPESRATVYMRACIQIARSKKREENYNTIERKTHMKMIRAAHTCLHSPAYTSACTRPYMHICPTTIIFLLGGEHTPSTHGAIRKSDVRKRRAREKTLTFLYSQERECFDIINIVFNFCIPVFPLEKALILT